MVRAGEHKGRVLRTKSKTGTSNSAYLWNVKSFFIKTHTKKGKKDRPLIPVLIEENLY